MIFLWKHETINSECQQTSSLNTQCQTIVMKILTAITAFTILYYIGSSITNDKSWDHRHLLTSLLNNKWTPAFSEIFLHKYFKYTFNRYPTCKRIKIEQKNSIVLKSYIVFTLTCWYKYVNKWSIAEFLTVFTECQCE
jgi:hypothetical protein